MGSTIARLKYCLILLFFSNLFAQTGARYLVITPDAFSNTLQPLVEWKYKKGMKPALYTTSQIGGSDSITVRNFIRNCYNNWDIKPEFVILIGHPGYIPMCYYQYAGRNYYTDNYYANMDGDLYNEIIPGRISVSDINQLTTVISKIFAYERYPLIDDSLWFKKGCAIANCDGSDDSTYLHCMRYAESLAVHNGFVQVDTFCDYYGHNSSHIINAINEGRSFVMYRGNANNHWYSPFDVNPYSTANGEKLPIIISATCRTVSSSSSPILGENFLRAGTPSSLKGAVGFFGGTRNTGSAAHLRNAVAIGFLDAIFIEDKRTFGEAGEGGRLRVYQQWGELREYNNFTCLGDPELNLWTDVPCSLEVQYPPLIPLGNANFIVNVGDAVRALPISNAFVCVAGKSDTSVYVLDTTDANGDAFFNITPQIVDDTVFVTVTGKNLQPYEGFMIVRILDYSYVVYLNSFINDSIAGNNDGYINPNEEIELPLWVENIGESTGVNITGTLSINDTFVTITDSVKNFGDIPGRDSAYTGQDGYNFLVAHSCPNQHQIDFELKCTDINDSLWISHFSKIVYAPELIFDDYTISGGNGNNIVEPGETVSVVVTLGNEGDAPADSVYAILRCSLAEVTVLDSVGTFGHIGIDSVKDNSTDPFVICVSPGTPLGTRVSFDLFVFSNYCDEQFSFELIVGQKNYYLWNPDPTPESGQNIHTTLANIGYNGDYGVTLPADLNLYHCLLVCLGVYSNRYLITDGSGPAITLTNFLNSGGRVYLEGSSVWYIDPTYYNGHNFGPLFGLSGIGYSQSDMGPVEGQSGTFTNGMYFDYGGENNFMDHINPSGSGFLIFRDQNNSYNCGVANDAGDYQTVGTSFELGLLNDSSPPSTRAALLDSIMQFFGVANPGVEESKEMNILVESKLNPLFPSPFYKKITINYQIADSDNAKDISLKIYDATGRLVKQFTHLTNQLLNKVIWHGRDDLNRPVPAGVYFVRLECRAFKQVEKAILLK